MRKLNQLCAAALALLLAASAAGCGAAPGEQSSPAAKAFITTGSGLHRNRYWDNSKENKYTQADYDLALSFQTDGFEKLSVLEFDKKVLDWENEDTFHKNEEALERLSQSLPEDDKNGEFIFRTLFTSWRESEKKHYNACHKNSAPYYDGSIKSETLGDIYGDQVVLSGAYADFSFNYNITDETKLTVGRRDSLLKQIETGMSEFLIRQEKAALSGEETMEKTLEAELKRQLGTLKDGVSWAGDMDLSYWSSQPWEPATDTGEQVAVYDEYPRPGQNTKANYDKAVKGLKFDKYEEMSIADFNRKINAALHEEKDSGDLYLMEAYELARCDLKETDPNYTFFEKTVPASQEEYEARAKTVYSGKPVDPEYSAYANAELQEDVFGDLVTTGNAMADYTFTYRILDEKKLTVKERDEFLAAVQKGVQDFLAESLKGASKEMSQNEFEKGLEAAGKAADTAHIQFTGYEVEDFEIYR